MRNDRAPSSGTRPARGARTDKRPVGLYVAVYVFLVVGFIRPQDILPVLGLIKPGMVSTIFVLLLWIANRPKDYATDVALKWQYFFLAVMILGLPIVVNHSGWYGAVLAIGTSIVGFSWGLPAVARYPDWRWSLLRLMLVAFFFVAIWTLTHGGVGTASWMGDENDAAAALIVGGCLAWAFWSVVPAGFWKYVSLAAAACCVAGVIATESRGGFLGMVAAILAILFFSGRLVRYLIAVAALTLLAYPFVPEDYKADVRSINDPTDRTREERIYSWQRGLDVFQAYPLIGVGPGNFAWRVGEFELSEEATRQRGDYRMISGRAAHSLYFTLIPELGLGGIIAFVALTAVALRRALRVVKAPIASVDPSLRIIALWTSTGLAGYLVASVFISTLYYPPFWMFVGLSILLSPDVTVDPQGKLGWTRLPSSARRRFGGQTVRTAGEPRAGASPFGSR